jgi:hypothetical protein
MKRTASPGRSAEREPDLKGKNAVYLWAFISINIAVYLCLSASKAITESSLDHFWQRVTMKHGIVAAGVPILAIILAGVLGDVGKARLVFWRWKDPLPGCRAFSKLADNDSRIDMTGLRSKLGEFPSEPKAQNALWYRLYRKHGAALRVLQAHKVYLLTRDMTAISAFFAIVMSTSIFLQTATARIGTIYAVALIAQYLLIATAARNYGERFVTNVLLEETQS